MGELLPVKSLKFGKVFLPTLQQWGHSVTAWNILKRQYILNTNPGNKNCLYTTVFYKESKVIGFSNNVPLMVQFSRHSGLKMNVDLLLKLQWKCFKSFSPDPIKVRYRWKPIQNPGTIFKNPYLIQGKCGEQVTPLSLGWNLLHSSFFVIKREVWYHLCTNCSSIWTKHGCEQIRFSFRFILWLKKISAQTFFLIQT